MHLQCLALPLGFAVSRSRGHNISQVAVSFCIQAGHVDSLGRCVLVHAAQRGHLDVLRFLLKRANWSCTSCCGKRGAARCQALQQALIAAASMGHTEVTYKYTHTHFFIILWCLTGLLNYIYMFVILVMSCVLRVDGIIPPESSRGRGLG